MPENSIKEDLDILVGSKGKTELYDVLLAVMEKAETFRYTNTTATFVVRELWDVLEAHFEDGT